MIFDEEITSNIETLPGIAKFESIAFSTHGAPEGVTCSPSFEEIREVVAASRKLIRPNRSRPAEN